MLVVCTPQTLPCHYHGPITTLLLPCHYPTTSLPFPCHYPATTPPLRHRYPNTTLTLPYHFPTTSLPLPCHYPDSIHPEREIRLIPGLRRGRLLGAWVRRRRRRCACSQVPRCQCRHSAILVQKRLPCPPLSSSSSSSPSWLSAPQRPRLLLMSPLHNRHARACLQSVNPPKSGTKLGRYTCSNHKRELNMRYT